jgi:p-aminobenzoyl-glutamate transporter AbgT
MHHHHVCCGHAFFKLLLLGFILINILLTIIVSLDMARIGRFNGLWIPVVLLAGIPASMIYALFRIGDRIPCKSST